MRAKAEGGDDPARGEQVPRRLHFIRRPNPDGHGGRCAVRGVGAVLGQQVLGRVKLQVHAAVGLELRKIPSELRRALQLKAKLLPAALKHIDHLRDIPAKKARQEGEGRGGLGVLNRGFT